MTRIRLKACAGARARWLVSSAVAAASCGLASCDTETATTVVVDNDYPPVPDAGDPGAEVTVFKVWWVTSLLPDPVGPGSEGQPQRTAPSTDFAYAVLAPGWDPSSAAAPTQLLPAKSVGKLSVDRGGVLHVHVSDALFAGNCKTGRPLSQDDADFITASIFPREFSGVAFDAKSCAVLPAGDGSTATTPDAGALDAAVLE